MKLIFVNSCIRKEDSRTLKIARNILQGLSCDIEVKEINLNDYELISYNYKENPYNTPAREEFKKISIEIANSDGVVIAAPFWDMSFPSLLKTFLEKLSLPDIMFKDDGTTCLGIAKCPFMFYITTRGMNIPDGSHLEQATPYLKALCELWGIKKFDYVSAHNLDYLPQEKIDELIEKAGKTGLERLNNLL